MDERTGSPGSVRTTGPDDLLEQVLRAERDAEGRLAEARQRAVVVIEAARAQGQQADLRTDARLETCRRLFSERTEVLAQAISDGAEDGEGAARAGPDADRRRDAARQIARRLVGIDP